MAALLQCRKNGKSLFPSCCHDCHGHRKGSLAKANCTVSSPHLLRPPGCTLRRNAPQADSHTDSLMSFVTKRPRCVCALLLGSPSVSPGTFWKSSSALLEKLLTGLGSLLTPLYLPKPRNNLNILCLTRNPRSRTAPPTLQLRSSPILQHNVLPHPSRNVTGTPFLALLLTCSPQISSLLPCSPTDSPGTPGTQVVPVSDNSGSKGQDLSACAPGKDPLLLRGKVRKNLGSSGKPTAQHHPCHIITFRTFSENSQNFHIPSCLTELNSLTLKAAGT